ncbi:MAG: acyl-CoA desaturase [Cyclobacteriaceae bacterium]|nr:acyl-CoA desaturase [Cyclobacteriaceae bacterium]
MIRYKFSTQLDKEFSKTLIARVNAYFSDNQLGRNGNVQMVLKSIAALTLYLAPFIVVLTAGITSIPVLFGLWIVMGLGKAFIGTAVMHDALHGSYSRKKWANKLMSFSAFMVGANPAIWKLQHNVLHHTYTNIEDADEDIRPRFVLRFSPHQPRRWFHRYQFLYAPFFYSISTLFWATAKDFDKLVDYRNRGLVQRGKEFNRQLFIVTVQKVLYLAVFLGLPIAVLPIPVWIVVLMFVSMHMVTGLLLTIIFQLAHVVPSSEFLKLEEEHVDQSRLVHQLLTTSNFAMGNKVLTWFLGGLNFQVEHHLFPNICHVHYRKIAAIVQQTTREFNLPYYAQKSFGSALRNHFAMLRLLGRQDAI